MRAICVSREPTAEQQTMLTSEYKAINRVLPLDVGTEYTVLGLGFWDGLTWFEIAVSQHTIVSLPAFLFRVTNGRISRYWEVRIDDDGIVTMWPPSFYRLYYIDDVSEGRPEAWDDFQLLFRALAAEAAYDG